MIIIKIYSLNFIYLMLMQDVLFLVVEVEQMQQQQMQQQMQQQQEMQAIAMKLQEAGIPVTSETVQKVMEQKKMMGGFLQEKAGQGMDAMRGLLQ